MMKPFLILITQIRMIKFNFVIFNQKKLSYYLLMFYLCFTQSKRGLNQVIRQIKHETLFNNLYFWILFKCVFVYRMWEMYL